MDKKQFNPPTADKRRHQLKEYHYLLNTEAGRKMVVELRSAWATANPLDQNTQTMGFNVGLGEAYKQLEAWQAGDGLDIDGIKAELEELREDG